MSHFFKKTFGNSVIYGFGNLFSKLVGFILLPMFTNLLNLDEYGAMGLLEITQQVIVGTFGLGIHLAFERWYWEKESRGKQKRIFFSINVFSIAIGLVYCLSFCYFAEPISFFIFDDSRFSFAFQLMAIAGVFEMLLINISSLLRIKERAILYTKTFILRFLINLILTVILLKKGYGIDGVYIARLIAFICSFLYIFRFALKHLSIGIEWKILKDMVRYRLPLILSTTSILLLSFTDRYTLNFMNGLDDTGLYSFGFKLANTLKVVVIASAWTAIAPMVFKLMTNPDNKKIYAKIMRYSILGTAILALALNLFSYEIIKLVSRKPEYEEAYIIVPLIVFSLIFGFMKEISTTGLLIQKKTSKIAIYYVLISVINIGLNIPLIYWLDSTGAAIATILCQFLIFYLIYRASQKEYYIPYDIKALTQILMLFGLLSVIGMTFNSMDLIPRIGIKMAIWILMPLSLLLIRFFTADEIKMAKGFWLKWRNIRNLKDNLKSLKNQGLV